MKRSHKLLANGRSAFAPHPRKIEQLMKLTGVKATSKPKRVPGHVAMKEVDNSEKLGDVEVFEYRSCVGILLYLAIDLPHAQHLHQAFVQLAGNHTYSVFISTFMPL